MSKVVEKIKKSYFRHGNKKVIDLEVHRIAKQESAANKKLLNDLEKQFDPATGDPLYHTYMYTLSSIMPLVNLVTSMPDLAAYRKLSEEQEDLYAPGYPPMSPVTDSYYQWRDLCDLRFGNENLTVMEILIEMASFLPMNSGVVDIMKKMSESRMGLYELKEYHEDKIVLQEVVSKKTFKVYSSSGYQGKIGQLWYVRLVPPLMDSIDYHAVMTTPYVVASAGVREWEAFFLKNNINEGNLYPFMKYGPSINYWSEFIFWGFLNYVDTAIFMTGFPDKFETMPAHNSFKRTALFEQHAHAAFTKNDFAQIVARHSGK